MRETRDASSAWTAGRGRPWCRAACASPASQQTGRDFHFLRILVTRFRFQIPRFGRSIVPTTRTGHVVFPEHSRSCPRQTPSPTTLLKPTEFSKSRTPGRWTLRIASAKSTRNTRPSKSARVVSKATIRKKINKAWVFVFVLRAREKAQNRA